jgi:hypothetical protein
VKLVGQMEVAHVPKVILRRLPDVKISMSVNLVELMCVQLTCAVRISQVATHANVPQEPLRMLYVVALLQMNANVIRNALTN